MEALEILVKEIEIFKEMKPDVGIYPSHIGADEVLAKHQGKL